MLLAQLLAGRFTIDADVLQDRCSDLCNLLGYSLSRGKMLHLERQSVGQYIAHNFNVYATTRDVSSHFNWVHSKVRMCH